MEKNFSITISKSTVLPLMSEEEAQKLVDMIIDREMNQTFIGNIIQIETEIKELNHV